MKPLLNAGLWLAGLTLSAAGCGIVGKPSVAEDSACDNPTEVFDLTSQAQAWADSLYEELTVEQRLAQMLMPAVFSRSDLWSMEHLRWYAEDLQVGSILLLKGDAESAAAIADTLESIRDRLPHSPGIFLAVDAETGLGMRFSDAPLFPWNSNINREADEETFFEYGREVGREARIAGINMILGPVVDVDRDESRGGIMRRRSLGSDQIRVAELSIAYARGLESQGVASVAKHFPGHGPTASDSHKALPIISLSRDELFAIDLMPFRSVVHNGLSCIMVGHIWAQELDSVRRPASFSPVMIQDLLRDEMGFKGLVLVDAVGMGAAKGFTGADAIIAGADIIIAPPNTSLELDRLIEAYNDGSLSPERVEDTCKRILFYKYLRGVNTSIRRLDYPKTDSLKIEERLHEEAPDIIDRLTTPGGGL